jgi:hypothetical protein
VRTSGHGEYKTTEPIFYCNEQETDEWDHLFERSSYWRTLRVTAWILRFVNNCRSKARRDKRRNGPLNTDEIMNARNKWVWRVQQKDQPDIQSPGWRLVEERDTGILKCEGRVTSYQPNILGEERLRTSLFLMSTIRSCISVFQIQWRHFEERGGFQSYVRK